MYVKDRSPSHVGLTSKSISLFPLPHSQVFITCYIKSNLTQEVGLSPAFSQTTYILLTYNPEIYLHKCIKYVQRYQLKHFYRQISENLNIHE